MDNTPEWLFRGVAEAEQAESDRLLEAAKKPFENEPNSLFWAVSALISAKIQGFVALLPRLSNHQVQFVMEKIQREDERRRQKNSRREDERAAT